MTLFGLAMVGCGIYLFVEYKKSADTAMLLSPADSDQNLIQLGRPMQMAVSLSSSIFDNLPKHGMRSQRLLIVVILCFLFLY